MITLFQPKPMFGLPNASPYCLKLEAFLRWQDIPFTIQEGLPFQGPFNKVPFVDYNGERLGDSSLIIDRLIQDKNIRYPEGLDMSIGHAFQRLTEDHLYWAMVYFRWMDNRAWPILREAFFGQIPFPVRPFIVSKARKQARNALYGQGLGRLPESFILERARADLSALSQRLTAQPFVCGQHMTHYDCSIWAVLSQLVNCELKIQLTDVAAEFPNLKLYVERVSAQLGTQWASTDRSQGAFVAA